MQQFFEQVFSLLNSPTGSLAYHLVISFTLIGVLQYALSYWKTSQTLPARRLVFGISLLVGFQVILFGVAGLAWMGLVAGERILPILDRAVNLLSLVVIVWLWVFPERTRSADASVLMVGLLLLTVVFLGVIWFYNLGSQTGLQNTLPNSISYILAISITAGGIVLLLLRRPIGWVAGSAMLAIILLGYSVQILLTDASGDYQGAVRLAMMAAYPLLFLLPLRLSPVMDSDAYSKVVDSASTADSRLLSQTEYDDAAAVQTFMASVVEIPAEQTGLLVNRTLANSFQADVCMLVSRTGTSGAIQLLCGYDRVNDLPLAGATLDKQQAPVLVSAMRQGRAVRLSAKSTSPDSSGIARVIGLVQTGYLSFVPILSTSGVSEMGILMISPYTNRQWTAEDQSRLVRMGRPLVYFLQLKEKIAALQKDLVEARTSTRLALGRAELAEGEYQRLLKSAAWLKSDVPVDLPAPGIDAEGANPKLAWYQQASGTQADNAVSYPQQVEDLRDQLKLALEELASLKATASQVETKKGKNRDTLSVAVGKEKL